MLVFVARPGTERRPEAQLRGGLAGPLTVRDPNGARYLLARGWTVGGISPDAKRFVTELRRHGRQAVTLTTEASPPAAPAEVAARSTSRPCARSLQLNALVGTTPGVLCTFPDAHEDDFYVYARGRSWTIGVRTDTVPGDELDSFRDSFTFSFS